MKAGPYAGRKVSEAKPLIKDELIAAGQAMPYSEPEKQVRGVDTQIVNQGVFVSLLPKSLATPDKVTTVQEMADNSC
jgi:hypothetical protein